MTDNNLLIYFWLDPNGGILYPIKLIVTSNINTIALYSSRNNGNSFDPAYGYFIFEATNPVVSTTEAINCLTEEQQDIMAHKIMTICDICDCQLTQ